jgi:hypothetical protein
MLLMARPLQLQALKLEVLRMRTYKHEKMHMAQSSARFSFARSRFWSLHFGIILPLVLLGSCSMPGLNNASHPSAGGAIEFQVNASAARILVPTLDMNIATYTYTGTGPGNATFSAAALATGYTASNLVDGSWSVTVNGLNAAGTVIDTGTASVNVVTGQTATVSIVVAPIAGNGTLTVTLTWPVALVSIPQITASLTSTAGVVTPLAFSAPANGTSTYTGIVANGYYTLSIQLLNNGQLIMGSVEIARIVTGQSTTGTYNYTNVNVGQGSIIVNITPAVTNPIPVTVTGAAAAVATGTPMNLSASVSAGNTVTYVWYANGASVGTGATFALNTATSPLPVGSYRVDCLAFSANGQNGGDSTFFVNVTPATSAKVFTFIGSVASTGNNSGISLTTPSSLNVMAGDLLVAVCSSESAATLTIDDGGGNTFTMLAQSSMSGQVYQNLGYVLRATANSAMTPVLHCSPSANYIDFIVMQFRPTGTAIFDVGPSSGTGSSTSAQSGNITTAGTSELIIGGSSSYGNSSSGYYSGQKIAGGAAAGFVNSYYGSLWYSVFSTPQTGIGATTTSPNASWCADIMAFK